MSNEFDARYHGRSIAGPRTSRDDEDVEGRSGGEGVGREDLLHERAGGGAHRVHGGGDEGEGQRMGFGEDVEGVEGAEDIEGLEVGEDEDAD